MNLRPASALFVCTALVASAFSAETPKPDADGFVPMFNGRDLTGWTNINCAPETWSVRDGKIYCSGKPVGGLRTVKQYENFIVELEWRHLQRSGNSGFFAWGSAINAPGVPFLRGIEVQMLDRRADATRLIARRNDHREQRKRSRLSRRGITRIVLLGISVT